MPKIRGYQQYCPMATALDVIGDRWALLVVRELILGPRRFTELAAGLPGIGTDVLTARLRALEAAGVLVRSGAGRRQRYELTARGRSLRPVLVELGRWGAGMMSLPGGPEEVAPRTGLTTLLLDPPPAPKGLAGVFDIRCAGETARARVREGVIALAPAGDGEPAEPATAVIELTRAGLLGVLAGADPRDLADRGDLGVLGDQPAAATFLAAIAAPEVLAELMPR